MEKKSLDDEKLKNILKHKLYEHSNIILNEKFFDKMETLGLILILNLIQENFVMYRMILH